MTAIPQAMKLCDAELDGSCVMEVQPSVREQETGATSQNEPIQIFQKSHSFQYKNCIFPRFWRILMSSPKSSSRCFPSSKQPCGFPSPHLRPPFSKSESSSTVVPAFRGPKRRDALAQADPPAIKGTMRSSNAMAGLKNRSRQPKKTDDCHTLLRGPSIFVVVVVVIVVVVVVEPGSDFCPKPTEFTRCTALIFYSSNVAVDVSAGFLLCLQVAMLKMQLLEE